MTKISFIVVAYNAAQSLDALLGDLLAQTVDPRQLEALLVDSASTDDTAQIMRRFAERAPFEVKLLENPKRWLACGINVALRAATGDAIIRLDAHARMPKDFLQKNLDALARGQDIVGRPRQRLGSRHARAGYLALLRRRSPFPQRRRSALRRYAGLRALSPRSL